VLLSTEVLGHEAGSPTQTDYGWVATQGKPVNRVLCFVTLMSHDCWQGKGHIFLSFRGVTAVKYSTNQCNRRATLSRTRSRGTPIWQKASRAP